jgi:hypothetical protein
VEDADADEAEVILAVMAVEVTTVAEARELLSTTIRRLHHHYACCETTLAITCGVSPCIIFGSIFKQDPQRDTGDLLILKALCFSIGCNILILTMKPIIKPILKPAISYVVQRYNEIRNANDLTDPTANLYMVIFSSRLPIYMHLAFIPGIIITMIRSTLHSISNVLRNIGDSFKDSKILWSIARVIKWAISPKECRQAHRL